MGNIWKWLQDCVHDNFVGAPTDGAASIEGGDCKSRVARGGSWRVVAGRGGTFPETLRSTNRGRTISSGRADNFGLRVARTLLTP